MNDYRLFVSHSWSYDDDYRRFLELLDRDPYFRYVNYSSPSYDAIEGRSRSALERGLRDQIRPAQVVVVLGGMYVAYSDWIQTEIDIAEEMGKAILGVYPWGSQRMPSAVQQAAWQLVGWRSESITQAIRELLALKTSLS